jgi:hypothetical protein
MKNINLDTTESYLLNSVVNYKNYLDTSLKEILIKYTTLVTEYIELVSEKINITKMYYYKYIFIRGLDTITTVFKLLLYLTKNIELSYYHSQKAFYFYVEFIEQISDDQNSFLQLSSREACMFVYKKTIFEINNDFRKNMLENTEELYFKSIIDNYLYIYKHIVNYCINHSNFTFNNKIAHIHLCRDEINKYSCLLNANCLYFSKNNIETIYLFIINMIEQNISIKQYFEILNLFIKKILDKHLLNIHLSKRINLKMNDNDIVGKIYDSKLFIDLIFE